MVEPQDKGKRKAAVGSSSEEEEEEEEDVEEPFGSVKLEYGDEGEGQERDEEDDNQGEDGSDGLSMQGSFEGELPELDENEEIEVPPSVWDIPFVAKAQDGKTFWKCLHCNIEFKGVPNATKAKAHLAKVTKQEIKICTAIHPKNYAEMYRKQWHNYVTSKESRKRKYDEEEGEAESRRKAGVQAFVENVSSRTVQRYKKFMQKKTTPKKEEEESRKQPAKMRTPKTSGGIQTYLTANHPNVAEADLEMDYLIASYIYEEGRSPKAAESENFHRIMRFARNTSLNYKPPNAKKLNTDYLEALFKQRYKEIIHALNQEVGIFGLAIYGDGATIARTPFFNVLASGVHMTNACLEIHNCSSHLAEGNRKDANYIADVINNHLELIDPRKSKFDLVIFDGASNMQKAGKILEANNPRLSCIHGSEHVVSLFFLT
jgi:hypothetical protein